MVIRYRMFVFQLSHVIEDAEVFLPDDSGTMKNTWAIHQLFTTVNFATKNKIMNWFTGDIGYHHVHHLNHQIPFYRLREAMAGITEMQKPLTTSLSPKDIAACLRLKVWDPELGQMAPL